MFPWVRLKKYIEIRAFDTNTPDIVLAIVALVKGLFYSPSSLNAVEALVGAYDKAMVEDLLHEAMLYGLDAEVDEVSFRDMLLVPSLSPYLPQPLRTIHKSHCPFIAASHSSGILVSAGSRYPV